MRKESRDARRVFGGPLLMSNVPQRTSTRLDPTVAWTYVTDAPLMGISLAREAGYVLAWDEGENLVLLDVQGQQLLSSRSPARVTSAAVSDDGSLIAAILDGGRIVFLSRELEPLADRAAPPDATSVTVDPHGRYAAVTTRGAGTHFYTKHGKPAGRFETLQPLVHIRFVPDRPMLLGASAYGILVGVDLAQGDRAGALEAEVRWQQQLLSNVGRLATTGDGGMVLASCFTHGVQRYDARGHNEGAYHLGGTASHAVPDFAGRTIAVATTEGELAILNQGGNVRWKTALGRGPIGLECDALGRFILHGLPTGEITRLDLESSGQPAKPAPVRRAAESAHGARPGAMRTPEWSVPVAQSEDQAETAVLTVLDQPVRVGVISNRNRLQVFTGSGGALGQAPEIAGIGRILRTAPGWIVAATDRQVVLYDARRNGAQRLDVSLVEVTHLVARPDTYGIAIVQERDRVGRASISGRWVWKRELRSPVEDLAVGPEALTAVTTDDGQLLIFDPAGEPAGQYAADPPEPLSLVEAPAGSPANVVWLTLARRFQVLRGHRQDGRVVWESPIPWEAWQLHAIEGMVIVAAPDGRALAYDGTGHQRAQSRADAAQGVFFAGPNGEAWRVARQGMHLICTDLFGRVNWRTIVEEPLGPLAAGRAGVAAIIGRSLAWFPSPPPGDLGS